MFGGAAAKREHYRVRRFVFHLSSFEVFHRQLAMALISKVHLRDGKTCIILRESNINLGTHFPKLDNNLYLCMSR